MRGTARRTVYKRKRWPAILIAAAAVLLIGGAAFFTVSQVRAAKYIADGVAVNGFSVGGMTVDEATEALQNAWPLSALEKPISLVYSGESLEVDLTGALRIDYALTAQQALERGKSGEKDLPLAVEIQEEALEPLILEFARDCEQSYNMFELNDDFTQVQVQTKDIVQLLDSSATIQQLAGQAAKNSFEPVDAVTIDTSAEQFPHQLYLRLVRPAKDASVAKDADGKEYIVAHVVGIEADEAVLTQHLQNGETAFAMPVTPVMPDVLIKDLDIAFYQDVLGEHISYYDLNLVNRSKNVALAASLIDGYEIMPGKTFSYNGAVGERTYERGFRTAIVYTGEGTEEGLGGGICQVSSTLYSAQLKADLETVERTNHSYTVVYVPLGQDATVVYGVLDYRFKNNTNYPVKISATASGGVLTIRLLGTKVDKSVSIELEHERVSTLQYHERTVEDDSLPAGEQQIKQKGQSGAIINTYKIYKKDGVVTDRVFVHKSTYRPMDRIVLVGKKQADGGSSNAPAAENPQAPETPEAPVTPQTPPSGTEPVTPPASTEPVTPQTPSGTEPVTPQEPPASTEPVTPSDKPETPAPPEDPPKEPVENEAFYSESGL